MFKIIIAVILLITIASYDGVNTYKDVETLSDLGSLINSYLSCMTAIILLAFGIDDVLKK